MQKLLTVKEVSISLYVHPNTIYKLVKKGEIPSLRIKGVGIRFEEEKIKEWVAERSSRAYPLLEPFIKADLALDSYDKLFLKGGKTRMGQKAWSYPFGSVYLRLTKLGKERWYIYYRIDGQRVREVVKGAQSRTDALKVLQVKVADAFRGKYGFKKEEKRVKFSEFAEEYIEKYAKVNKRSWKDDVYSIGMLNRFWGGRCIYEISAYDIEGFKTKRCNEGISRARVNRNLALLKKMFNLAMDWGYLKENPVRKVRLFSEKDNLKERILSAEEEKKLLEVSSEHLRPIIITALCTGMRRGEILSLRWSQVDLSRRTIRADKTKSGRIRIIPINDTLLEGLSRLKKDQKSDHVFLYPKTGKPMSDIKTAFNAATRRAGIKGLRFHDLRHTFASRLVEKGVDLITVKDLLGHYSVTVTQRYTHSNSEQKRRAVDSLLSYEKPLNFIPILSTRKESRVPGVLFTDN
jgi:excisionase family DNA binding protein